MLSCVWLVTIAMPLVYHSLRLVGFVALTNHSAACCEIARPRTRFFVIQLCSAGAHWACLERLQLLFCFT
jgi:hypothetical protein